RQNDQAGSPKHQHQAAKGASPCRAGLNTLDGAEYLSRRVPDDFFPAGVVNFSRDTGVWPQFQLTRRCFNVTADRTVDVDVAAAGLHISVHISLDPNVVPGQADITFDLGPRGDFDRSARNARIPFDRTIQRDVARSRVKVLRDGSIK